jgi:hypothetical protein
MVTKLLSISEMRRRVDPSAPKSKDEQTENEAERDNSLSLFCRLPLSDELGGIRSVFGGYSHEECLAITPEV